MGSHSCAFESIHVVYIFQAILVYVRSILLPLYSNRLHVMRIDKVALHVRQAIVESSSLCAYH